MCTSLGNVLLAAGETAADDVDNLLVTGGRRRSFAPRAAASRSTPAITSRWPLGTTVQAGTSVNLNVDEGDLDPTGETLSVFGSVISTTGANLTGGNDNDTFNVARPDHAAASSVSGEDPFAVPVGDTLNLDITGATSPTLSRRRHRRRQLVALAIARASRTPASKRSTRRAVSRTTSSSTCNWLGFQDGVADEIFVRMDATGTDLLIDVNGTPVFQGLASTINSLTVIGCSDDDRLRIDETAGGLPQFLGQTPAVNNVGIGGGTANPSHLGPSADQILETLFAAGTPWDASDVTIHFDGRTGVDSIDLNLITFHATAYTSDTLDGANSGNLGTAGLGVDFLMSFANLAPLNLSGAGGLLLIDATGTPDHQPHDQRRRRGQRRLVAGLRQRRLRDDSLSRLSTCCVIGGNGTRTDRPCSASTRPPRSLPPADSGRQYDRLLRHPGDGADDTIRIRSTPSQTPVSVDADGGNDLIQLFDAALTVDNILAAVTINGDTGTNTLVVIDRGDAGPDTILIDENSIEGNHRLSTGTPGHRLHEHRHPRPHRHARERHARRQLRPRQRPRHRHAQRLDRRRSVLSRHHRRTDRRHRHRHPDDQPLRRRPRQSERRATGTTSSAKHRRASSPAHRSAWASG